MDARKTPSTVKLSELVQQQDAPFEMNARSGGGVRGRCDKAANEWANEEIPNVSANGVPLLRSEVAEKIAVIETTNKTSAITKKDEEEPGLSMTRRRGYVR